MEVPGIEPGYYLVFAGLCFIQGLEEIVGHTFQLLLTELQYLAGTPINRNAESC